jgi:hypothetical protein
MLDDRNDINRPVGSDPYLNQRPRVADRRSGWGIPVVIAALLIIGGLFFYNTRTRGPDQTATNHIPSAASGPVAPGAPAPGPTSTAPAPNR